MTKKYESTLFDHLRKYPSLKIFKRLEIWSKVAKAVQAQHQEGIYHQDLKSNNVFINVEQDQVKELVVADFGIGIPGERHYRDTLFESPSLSNPGSAGASKRFHNSLNASAAY